jgi:DNA polymerase I-like protein with 3'-5' exonuclease and polymerase domains
MADMEAYLINDSWKREMLNSTYRVLEKMTPAAHNQAELIVDVETTGLEPWNGDTLRCTGVRPRGSVTSILTGVDGGKADLRKLLMDESKTLVMHNGQFDCMWGLEKREVPACRVIDTLYLHYLLDERYPSRGLKHLARLYTPFEPIDLPKGGVGNTTEELFPYCADDVGLTDLVREGVEEELDALGVEWHKNMELYGRVIPILAGMTKTGIRVDRGVLEEAREHEQAKVEEATQHLEAVWNANKPLRFEDNCPTCDGLGYVHVSRTSEETKKSSEDLDSRTKLEECSTCSGEGWCWLYEEWDISLLDRTAALSDFIYQHLGYPIPDMKGARRQDGRGSTAREVLDASLEIHGDPTGFVSAVYAYRDVNENLRKYVLDVERRLGLDNHVRPHFNIVTRADLPGKTKKSGARTGRMSVSKPGLHSTPGGHPMRRAFVGDTALVQIDRAQAELTDLASISRDPNLMGLINRKVDQHQRMADLATEAGYNMGRDEAKTVNFGILYGIGPKGLEQRTRFDRQAGSRFIDMWFGEYPRVKALQREVHYLALKRGFVETLSGRRRNFPLGLSGRSQDGGRAERQAFNFIIQALANDLNMLFLVGWCNQGLHELAFPIFLIHDAVLFSTADVKQTMIEFQKGYRTWFADMTEDFLGEQLDVVMRADAKFGPNWGEMKEKDDEGRKLFYFSTDPEEGYIDYATIRDFSASQTQNL